MKCLPKLPKLIVQRTFSAMEESANESVDLERRREPREWQRPEQYIKQERVFASVIAQQEKARES